jgi:hypothetical protein
MSHVTGAIVSDRVKRLIGEDTIGELLERGLDHFLEGGEPEPIGYRRQQGSLFDLDGQMIAVWTEGTEQGEIEQIIMTAEEAVSSPADRFAKAVKELLQRAAEDN